MELSEVSLPLTALTERWGANDRTRHGRVLIEHRDGSAMSVSPDHDPSGFERSPASVRRSGPAAAAPAPPAGQGSVLAWFESSPRSAISGAIGIFVIMVAGVVALQGFSVAWMRYWQPWAVLVVITVLFYITRRRTAVSAGEEWLQRRGGTWVRTHELSSVTAYPGIGSIRLYLVDQGGRKIRVSNHDLQENRRVWDLVYAGIVQSVTAGGARTNGLLHRAFDIPRPGSGSASSR